MPLAERRPKLEESRPETEVDIKIPKEEGAAPEAARFYDSLVEWLDLSREYKELTGKQWGPERKKSKKTPPRLEDKLKAIRFGNVGELLVPKEEETKMDEEQAKVIEERLQALDQEITQFKERPELRPEARARFQAERAFQERLQEVGSELDSLEVFENKLDVREFVLLKTRQGKLTGADRAMFEESAKLRQAVGFRKQEMETSPETSLATRLHELRHYRDGLAKERFAETPSRKKYLEEIRRLWEEGKNVFLSGPTGTGKTELFIYLAKKLYGESPEIIRGSERTGAPEIFGRILLQETPQGGTKTYFQSGRYTAAIDAGRPLIFDEFNLLDTKVRFQLKELYNRRAGDRVTIQEDTGQPHTIKEGFFFGATANIKGEKYKERFELDPAESRIFEMRRVDYLPKEELYDLCLAKLMDKQGGAPLSLEEASVTLKRLAEAAEMIQGAFLGSQTSLYEEGAGAKKKYATLEKAVLDPGRVLGIFQGWPVAEARGQTLEQYLNDYLRDFLNQEDFPEKDRKLILKILITKGFFQGRKPGEFHISGLKASDLEIWGWKPHPLPSLKLGEGLRERNYLRPEEVALLDPFEIRKGKIAAIGHEFLAGAPTPEAGKPKEAGSELTITIPDALNPYREAFVAGAIAEEEAIAERKEIKLDLEVILLEDSKSYQEAGLIAWAREVGSIDLKSITPEDLEILKQEVKDGAIPVFMPGREAQLETTEEDFIKKLKPIWIKDGQEQVVNDAYLWDYVQELIQRKAAELVKDISERPYILLTKPAQAPAARTTGKTVEQQKEELKKINQEIQRAGQPAIFVMNPYEYAALQKRFTELVKEKAPVALGELKPLDKATWIRFINLPLSSDGNVPSAVWNPGDREIGFVSSSAGDRDSQGGFRLSVRVEI